MACNDQEFSDDAAIPEAIERIAYEAHHLREDMAALKALGQARDRVNCPFMQVASSGLQSDLLARLARVLERDGRVGSFWFLHRRGVIQADRAIIKFLSDIADRLEPIRNKVFAHIDKEVLHDPQKPYRDADLHWLSDIEPAIVKISELVTRVYETRAGRPFPSANISIAGFQEIFDRDLKRLGKL
jgi:HEPN superfamily AbiU2-like protein